MSQESFTFLATASFNLEGLVRQELTELGFRDARCEMGGVRFTGTLTDAFRACLWLSCADRVLLVAAEGECRSFEELFQLARHVPWQRWIGPDCAFPVTAHCARSQLMSPSDCQKIVKKAAADALMEAHRRKVLPETGPRIKLQVTLHRDLARLTLDLCGDALNRRGYRTWNGEAPLRETLAAALCRLSRWHGETPLHDPFCGTGTLLIESAFYVSHRAPGLTRGFDAEAWPCADRKLLDALRENAREQYRPELIRNISGSDLDPRALELCRRHLKQAGLADRIRVQQADFRQLQLPEPRVLFLCNPPYGERLGDRKSAEKLYAAFPALLARHPGCRLGVICADPSFEKCAGLHAQKRTRLYNGRLECDFMLFEQYRKSTAPGRSR